MLSEKKVMADGKFKVGDRVIYITQVNNPGHCPPGQRCSGTIMNVIYLRNESPLYRIELDMVWNDKMSEYSRGKKMIKGNIFEKFISPLT
ncbi:MAG: hypothetical protein QG589_529 [Patescibacteria group bacterium]|nr:hypothetical protein [Patescibacteria group bacterium]